MKLEERSLTESKKEENVGDGGQGRRRERITSEVVELP